MKKLVLLLLGLIPFPVGYLVNYLMMENVFINGLHYTLVNLFCLAIWFLLGMFLHSLASTKIKAAAIANCPAFIVLLLILFQEVVLGQYWMNIVGIASQFFYMPFLYLTFRITPMFHTMSPTYIVAFCLMCIVFYWGCCVGMRRAKSA